MFACVAPLKLNSTEVLVDENLKESLDRESSGQMGKATGFLGDRIPEISPQEKMTVPTTRPSTGLANFSISKIRLNNICNNMNHYTYRLIVN